MLRLIAVALWAAGVALASAHVVGEYRARPKAETVETTDKRVARKLKPVTVPVVRDGGVQGYVVVQFDYVGDEKLMATLPVPPDTYVMDELFRAIYADTKLDLEKPERYDIESLVARVLERTRVRLASDAVKSLHVNEFNYVHRRDIK